MVCILAKMITSGVVEKMDEEVTGQMTFTAELASKVTASHLGRDAYVYVRQSTLTQMRENTESLERQYELARALRSSDGRRNRWWWLMNDLGRSGAEATAREGFKNLVADVGLGRVGIVLGIEVSRLARNNADWYQLLDLCALTDTLIADGDGLYHPGDFNDRLVIGLERHDVRSGTSFDPSPPHGWTAPQGSQR